MAKPKNPNKPKTYIIHSQVSEEIYNFVNEFAKKHNITKSQAIAQLLRIFPLHFKIGT